MVGIPEEVSNLAHSYRLSRSLVFMSQCKGIGAILELRDYELVGFNGLTSRSMGTVFVVTQVGEWKRITYQVKQDK